jgi:hypothetical protein
MYCLIEYSVTILQKGQVKTGLKLLFSIRYRNFIMAVPPTQQQDHPLRMLSMDVFSCQ